MDYQAIVIWEENERKKKIEKCKASLHLSYIITVSAVVRFIPNPPALVERMKQNLEEFVVLFIV